MYNMDATWTNTVWSHFYEVLELSNSYRQKAEWWLPGAGGGANRKLFNGYRVSLRRDEKVQEMNADDGCTIM